MVHPTNKEALVLEIANAASRYHREQQGRAPGKIRVNLAGTLVVVVTEDVYTANEEHLSRSEDGRKLIKSARRELRSLTRDAAHAEIAKVCGCPVLRSYWDFDIRVGEQLEVYVMSEDLEQKFS